MNSNLPLVCRSHSLVPGYEAIGVTEFFRSKFSMYCRGRRKLKINIKYTSAANLCKYQGGAYNQRGHNVE